MNTIFFELFLKNLSQLLLTVVVSSNMTSIIMKKIILQKISKYSKGTIKDYPFVDNISVEERKKAIDEAKLESILPFIEKLKNYTSEENLKAVYRNLSSIKIEKNKYILMVGAAGIYDSKKNKISYSSSSSLGHEILHLASSYYDHKNKESYDGFQQQKGMAIIGKGLNEGYTELLASRIYNKKNKVKSYKKEVKIAQLIELFFDDPKEMESFYFNHNLSGLIRYMEQFAPRKEIIKLILDIDGIYFLSSGFFPLFPIYNSIKVQIQLYNLFVAKNKDPEKLQQFKDLVCQSKIVSMIINKQKKKLYRQNPYDKKEQYLNFEGQRKI